MVPCTKDSRVGQVFPSLHHIRIGSETVGIEIPHAVVITLDTCTLKAVDATLIETADEVHAPVDVVTGVVVDLSLSIADDGL